MKIKMKAGTYYIGDNCYVLKEEYIHGFEWVRDFCNPLFDNSDNGDGLVVVDGKDVVAFGTAYGDGEYSSNIGFDFPVDAGIIGCTPTDLWKGGEPPFGCSLVEFKEDFICETDGETLKFGHIEIMTGDVEYDDQRED